MSDYRTPGVYKQEIALAPPAALRTGVPAFLGFSAQAPLDEHGQPLPQRLTLWAEFTQHFGAPAPGSVLAHAVQGFFANAGDLCYVVGFPAATAIDEVVQRGLASLAPLETIDLVCMPDLAWRRRQGDISETEALQLQRAVLADCERRGDRFAILDSLAGMPLSRLAALPQELRQEGIQGTGGALYYPWVRVAAGPAASGDLAPPCGHVAGVYARSDRHTGVHKAPANELLYGVLDLEVNLSDREQGMLNPVGVNCLRAFPGRGIRVWGARTLSADERWRYVNVRRLFLTAARWIEHELRTTVFEPHSPQLWARISREVTAYCNELLRRGALKGQRAEEAFYVQCDAATNPPAVREAGKVVCELGLAATTPNEFIIVRIVQSTSGVTIT